MRFRPNKPRFRNPTGIKPTPEAMLKLLQSGGLSLSPEQLETLWRYHNLIRLRNNDRELTRIIGFEPMVIKHYMDCMIVGHFWKLPNPLLDIGTGAGFPGIPLKIKYPETKFILAEPRPKRIQFLEECIRTLNLKDIEVFEHKVVSKSFSTPVAGVITRAVEEMEKTMLRTSACLPIGGQIIFMKGPGAGPEIEKVKHRFGAAFKIIFDKSYRLGNTENERRLIVYEKLAPVG